MKNKQLLVALSKLLKLDETVIVTELEKENGDDSIVKSFLTKYNQYSAEELSTLIKNSNKKYLETADFELTEVPKPLYSKIAAAALEVREKALAKEHGVTEYKDLQDLLAKIAESTKGKGVDETLKQQIETLKGTIKTLEQEKETEINKVKSQYETEVIEKDFSSALSSIPLDYESDVLEKQQRLLKSAFSADFKIQKKGNITIVLDKDGKPVVDKLGEPENISNVLKSFAVDYGFKTKDNASGGRGSASSEGQSTLSFKGKTFSEYLGSKGIQPNTDESDKAFVEWTAQQK